MDLRYETKLIAADERVRCPYAQRDVDIERCLNCGWLRSVGEDGRTLRCSAPAPGTFETDAPYFLG